MSLNWNIQKVVNGDKLCYEPDGKLAVATNSLLLVTMAIGMCEITQKNHEEFFKRLNIYETVFGAFLVRVEDDGKVGVPYKLSDIKAHIGLHTNASAITVAGFRKKIYDRLEREADFRLKTG